MYDVRRDCKRSLLFMPYMDEAHVLIVHFILISLSLLSPLNFRRILGIS